MLPVVGTLQTKNVACYSIYIIIYMYIFAYVYTATGMQLGVQSQHYMEVRIGQCVF